jgi:D-serine deaminase-like pyridoxal phosphate-dependent protein
MAVNQLGHTDSTKTGDSAGGIGTIPTTTSQAILKCEDNALRWRADGTAPTATVGKRMDVGDELLLVGNHYGTFLEQFSYINLTPGSNASLQIVFLTGFDRA